jgi:hypothetical protein
MFLFRCRLRIVLLSVSSGDLLAVPDDSFAVTAVNGSTNTEFRRVPQRNHGKYREAQLTSSASHSASGPPCGSRLSQKTTAALWQTEHERLMP